MHPGGAVHRSVVVALRFLGRHLTLIVTTVVVVVVFLFLSTLCGMFSHESGQLYNADREGFETPAVRQ